jgi:hypothetical protein
MGNAQSKKIMTQIWFDLLPRKCNASSSSLYDIPMHDIYHICMHMSRLSPKPFFLRLLVSLRHSTLIHCAKKKRSCTWPLMMVYALVTMDNVVCRVALSVAL